MVARATVIGLLSVVCFLGMVMFAAGERPEQVVSLEVDQEPVTVDDHGRLQAEIDQADGSVRLPAGTYHLSKPLVIELDRVGPVSILGDGDCRLIMSGEGPAIRFIGTHDGTADPNSVKPNVWENQRAPSVVGIEIVGDHPDADGIEATGTMQLMISRVLIRKARHGIRLVNRNRNVIISDCQIYENSGIGIFYDDVNLHQSNIGDCHISYNRGGGVVVKGGDVRNVHIGNCDIEGNMSEDGDSTANVLFDSRDGSVGEAAITGCTIQHDHRAPDGANIRIIGQSEPRSFTPERRHGHVTIQGNVLSDVQINIDLMQTRGVAIVGNTMWKGYEHDVRVVESESIVLSDNVFDRNPRYHYGDGVDARDGIVLDKVKGGTLSGNHFGGAGAIESVIAARDCEMILISAQNLSGFPKHAITLDGCRNCRVTTCLLQGSESNELEADEWIESINGTDIRID